MHITHTCDVCVVCINIIYASYKYSLQTAVFTYMNINIYARVKPFIIRVYHIGIMYIIFTLYTYSRHIIKIVQQIKKKKCICVMRAVPVEQNIIQYHGTRQKKVLSQ